MTPGDLSVAIPTYRREGVLVSTIEAVLEQAPTELLVVDQTLRHEAHVEAALARWDAGGHIRWLRLSQPSIPRAMNTGLREARGSLVLFLDDDVIPMPGLLEAHARAYATEEVWAVAGQVLQPGEEPQALPPGPVGDTTGVCLDIRFNSSVRAWVHTGIACNLSVRRDRALLVGGFDENFVGAAYRFETEFCNRLGRAGGKILFEPLASLRHLRAPAGGTRSHGSHLTSPSPAHGVGDYYFALRQGLSRQVVAYVMRRPLRAVCTRFHLLHPWWIPVKWIGEVGAFAWAVALVLRGPRYIEIAAQ